LYGTLSVPSEAEGDGPPNGLTLDQAIEQLIQGNLDLKSKSFEIPQARADVLTASLRANPLFYADSQLIPYGSFSKARAGGPTQYDVNISHPIDYARKRRARMIVAGHAVRVIEAQYQDAVRIEINNLYNLYIDVLAARQTLRYANASVKGLEDLLRATQRLREIAEGTSPAVGLIRSQLEVARIGVDESEELLLKARRALATVLNIPPTEADRIEIKGMIEDLAPPPPPENELIQLALSCRPDVVSYRMGIELAEANHKLMRANRYSDAYLLYQPFTYQNNSPFNSQSATSWAVGLTVPLPVYNRNQGNIERARLNMIQSRVDLASLERRVVTEVQQAFTDYKISGRSMRRIRDTLIPEAAEVAKAKFKLFESGELDVTAFLDAQRAYNDTVKQYLDTAIRHRRSMLALNTAVGQRVLP
jgi:cobalt-zinc-cadmium efflux system outer membrane protein